MRSESGLVFALGCAKMKWEPNKLISRQSWILSLVFNNWKMYSTKDERDHGHLPCTPLQERGIERGGKNEFLVEIGHSHLNVSVKFVCQFNWFLQN